MKRRSSLFDLGKVTGYEKDLDTVSAEKAKEYVMRHMSGDFGDITERRRKSNLAYIKGHGGGEFCVVSEYPRLSGTTVEVLTMRVWPHEGATTYIRLRTPEESYDSAAPYAEPGRASSGVSVSSTARPPNPNEAREMASGVTFLVGAIISGAVWVLSSLEAAVPVALVSLVLLAIAYAVGWVIDNYRGITLGRVAPGGNHSRYIPQSVKIAVATRDSGRCRHCGSTSNLVYDHITPYSRGGTSIVDNIQFLCQRCNSRKGNRWAG